MTMTSDAQIVTTRSAARATTSEAIQYRILLAVCFVICLPFALFAWLMPGTRRASGSQTSTTDRSIIGEAKAAASVAAGYAFQR